MAVLTLSRELTVCGIAHLRRQCSINPVLAQSILLVYKRTIVVSRRDPLGHDL
jgi:hypothetical protein